MCTASFHFLLPSERAINQKNCTLISIYLICRNTIKMPSRNFDYFSVLNLTDTHRSCVPNGVSFRALLLLPHAHTSFIASIHGVGRGEASRLTSPPPSPRPPRPPPMGGLAPNVLETRSPATRTMVAKC